MMIIVVLRGQYRTDCLSYLTSDHCHCHCHCDHCDYCDQSHHHHDDHHSGLSALRGQYRTDCLSYLPSNLLLATTVHIHYLGSCHHIIIMTSSLLHRFHHSSHHFYENRFYKIEDVFFCLAKFMTFRSIQMHLRHIKGKGNI